MFRRLLILAVMSVISLASMAFNLSGRTYRYSHSERGKTLVVKMKFTSSSRGVLSVSGSAAKAASISFTYEVDGGLIAVYLQDGSMDYFHSDDEFQSIYTLDDYDNYGMWLELVPSSSKSGSKSGKSSGKKKRK